MTKFSKNSEKLYFWPVWAHFGHIRKIDFFPKKSGSFTCESLQLHPQLLETLMRGFRVKCDTGEQTDGKTQTDPDS